MDKTELLALMSEYKACSPAMVFVSTYPSDDAQEIWRSCDRADWLCWFLARHNKEALSKLAFACADRAVRVYVPIALDKAGLHDEAAKLRNLPAIVDRATALGGKAAAYADAAAASYNAYADAAANAAANDAAATYADAAAANAAYAAADDADEERKLQLDQLREVTL